MDMSTGIGPDASPIVNEIFQMREIGHLNATQPKMAQGTTSEGSCLHISGRPESSSGALMQID